MISLDSYEDDACKSGVFAVNIATVEINRLKWKKHNH